MNFWVWCCLFFIFMQNISYKHTHTHTPFQHSSLFSSYTFFCDWHWVLYYGILSAICTILKWNVWKKNCSCYNNCPLFSFFNVRSNLLVNAHYKRKWTIQNTFLIFSSIFPKWHQNLHAININIFKTGIYDKKIKTIFVVTCVHFRLYSVPRDTF